MDVHKLTRIILAWELFESGMPQTVIAERLEVNRDTVRLWVRSIRQLGLDAFQEKYTNAKKGERAKRKIDGLLKAKVWNLREENRDCCGQKIKEFLWKEYGLRLSHTTIYKILRERYKLRSKWKKNKVRGPVPQAQKPREVIQMDTVDFGRVFAFCGIDIFTKEAQVKLYSSLTAQDGLSFLDYSFKSKYGHTELLQTDGGSEFKAEFRNNVLRYADRFREARPYKKNEQSYIESFNRSLRKECLGWGKYTRKDLPNLEHDLTDYLAYYHNKRPHMGLNMLTPSRFLKEQVPDF